MSHIRKVNVIIKEAKKSHALERRVKQAFENIPEHYKHATNRDNTERDKLPKEVLIWEQLNNDWCAYVPVFFYEMSDFSNAMKPSSKQIDDALNFLEADPYCFRSGYLKEKVLKKLKNVEISPLQLERLRNIILMSLEWPMRREFRYYCKLAKVISNGDFINALTENLNNKNELVKLKSSIMLDFITNYK